MSAGKVISYIVAALFIIFGALMVLAATDKTAGQLVWLPVGILFIIIGLVLIWFGSRQKPPVKEENVTLQIDLPADVNLDALTCQKCGAALTTENITMVAGAPVVNCPYCGTTYQLTEDPKW